MLLPRVPTARGTRELDVTFSPSQEEGNVESGAVEVDELKKEHLESEAVVPLRLCPRLLCGGEERDEDELNCKQRVAKVRGLEILCWAWYVHGNHNFMNQIL